MHEAFKSFLGGFRHDAHPMAMLVGMLGSMASFYHNTLDLEDPEQRRLAAVRLIAKVPTIAAACYRHSIGWPLRYPRNNLDYVDRFLHMMFEVPSEPLVLKPVAARALDLLFILHADHEQNCSANAMRAVGSSRTDPYCATAAAAAALYGPLHGGANEEAVNMLEEIGSVDRIPAFIKSVKAGERRLMGFGHRIYKNYDPRAKVIKRIAYEVFEVTGRNPLIDIATELERIALEDEYFVTRKLYPNVDFYSGIIYQAMGFPTTMFPVLFAIGRTPGWIAQWTENVRDEEQKIVRPRQIYIGEGERDYAAIEGRPIPQTVESRFTRRGRL
jgi:citrate synthase